MNLRRIQRLSLLAGLLLLLPGCGQNSSELVNVHFTAELNDRLKEFFIIKEQQARELEAVDKDYFAGHEIKSELLTKGLAPEVWPYFSAGQGGRWKEVSRLYYQMAERSFQFEVAKVDERLTSTVWHPINETFRAYEHFSVADPKFAFVYGQEIIDSIPPGSVFFSGTDAGRFVVTFLVESQPKGKPFFIISQNMLSDGLSQAYYKSMYEPPIRLPDSTDSQKIFHDYLDDVQRRLAENRLRPGEEVKTVDGRIQVKGQMAAYGLVAFFAKAVFEQNPEREYFLDEQMPMEWAYPHLIPYGFIFKINRESLSELPEEAIIRDRQFWKQKVTQTLGDWLTEETSVQEICAFVETAYLRKDLTNFTGDRRFITTARPWSEVNDFIGASAIFSKSRANIAGLYAWRSQNAISAEIKDRMIREAGFAFRQAFALGPHQTETVQKLLSFLGQSGQYDEMILVAQTAEKFHSNNPKFAKFLREVADRTKQAIEKINSPKNSTSPAPGSP